jgi:hypothetical protein
MLRIRFISTGSHLRHAGQIKHDPTPGEFSDPLGVALLRPVGHRRDRLLTV